MITGASSGIGEGLALELARRRAAVGLVARRAERLSELVKKLEAGGGKALALDADVNNVEELRKQADCLRSAFGPIDVLIANAGIGTISPALDLRTEDVAAVFKVNVLGAVNSVAAVLPEMISRRQGQLVAMSSLSAYRGLPKSAA
jgi:NADP-dependent 3-hydroxy acid dehydrogenase YdfG